MDITHRRGGNAMSTWIEVNGAKIEKRYFDENVREAKGYEMDRNPCR
jgi:hypothetical protein